MRTTAAILPTETPSNVSYVPQQCSEIMEALPLSKLIMITNNLKFQTCVQEMNKVASMIRLSHVQNFDDKI